MCAVSLWCAESSALPGIHAPAISTFDTRASSASLAYRTGLGDGTSRVYSYNANFTANSGNFSSQFGAHYLQLRDEPGVSLLHGAAASGVGLFSLPLGERFNNGVPKAALDLYVGIVPTAAVSGPRNFLTVPLTLGMGVTFSPTRAWSITPWAEIAPSVNLDTYIAPFKLVPDEVSEATSIDDLLNEQGDAQVVQPDVNKIIAEAVDLRVSLQVAPRFGLQSTVHVGDTWDLNLDSSVASFGAWLGGTMVVHLGVGIGAHWDSVAPAVLPAHVRLAPESCEAIAVRYRMCPGGAGAQSPPTDPALAPVPVSPSASPLTFPVPSPPQPLAPPKSAPTPSPPAPSPRPLPPLKAGKAPLRSSPYGD